MAIEDIAFVLRRRPDRVAGTRCPAAALGPPSLLRELLLPSLRRRSSLSMSHSLCQADWANRRSALSACRHHHRLVDAEGPTDYRNALRGLRLGGGILFASSGYL